MNTDNTPPTPPPNVVQNDTIIESYEMTSPKPSETNNTDNLLQTVDNLTAKLALKRQDNDTAVHNLDWITTQHQEEYDSYTTNTEHT